MTTHLCVDWGNSRMKAGVFVNDKLEKEVNFAHDEGVEGLTQLISEFNPNAAILASVIHTPDEAVELLSGVKKFINIDSNTNLPFLNAYQSPETLGADRLALVAGVQDLYPGETSLSICVGTAVTYNFLQRGRIFRGGNITPGVRLRLQSLQEHTEQLPLVSETGAASLLGFDTDEGIRGGVLWGLAAEIEGMIFYYKEQYNCEKVVITGGALTLLDKKFKQKIYADTHILLKGLNLILNHNA